MAAGVQPGKDSRNVEGGRRQRVGRRRRIWLRV